MPETPYKQIKVEDLNGSGDMATFTRATREADIVTIEFAAPIFHIDSHSLGVIAKTMSDDRIQLS